MANPALALPGRAPLSLFDRPNVAGAERAVSMLIGSVFAYWGLRHRHRAVGWVSTVAGGFLLERGATGRCVAYKALGVDTATPAAVEIRQAIQVARPRREVYAYWRDFTNLPRFMKHVRSVEVHEGGRSHWTVQAPPAPPLEWDAELVVDEPDERIAWRSLDDASVANAGDVRFTELPGARGTGLTLEFAYRPPQGVVGAAAAQLLKGVTEQEIREDLRRFKAMLEAGEVPRIAGQPSGRGRDEEDPVGGGRRSALAFGRER